MPKNRLSATVKSVKGLKTVSKVREFEFVMDEPKNLGGTDEGMNPVEALLSAIGGCKVIVARSFCRVKKIALEDITVKVEGDIDTDGFTGKNPEAKIGLFNIKTTYHIKADNTEEEIMSFIDFIEKTCPVADTIINSPNFEKVIEIQ